MLYRILSSSWILACTRITTSTGASQSKLDSVAFFFSSRRRHTRSVSAFLLNRSSDLKDQVYAQNEMLAYQQKESTARVASIMENTNLSKQQQVSEIMRQMLTQAQTAGQYFTNDQIKEMTRKVSAEVDLVHQQTQN